MRIIAQSCDSPRDGDVTCLIAKSCVKLNFVKNLAHKLGAMQLGSQCSESLSSISMTCPPRSDAMVVLLLSDFTCCFHLSIMLFVASIIAVDMLLSVRSDCKVFTIAVLFSTLPSINKESNDVTSVYNLL
jgi:hypothetical protein